jgi:hypothetical protein
MTNRHISQNTKTYKLKQTHCTHDPQLMTQFPFSTTKHEIFTLDVVA